MNAPTLRDTPYSQEAEEAVIGAVITNPAQFPSVAEILVATDFFLLRHQIIWEAITDAYHARLDLDYVVIVAQLQARKKLDDVGGHAYLLYCINNAPTSVHAETYARLVAAAAMRRRLLEFADSVQEWIFSNTSTEQVLTNCEDALYTLTHRMAEKRSWRIVTLEEMLKRPPVRWLVPGKLPAVGLAMLFGPSGVYKSFIALDMAIDVAQTQSVVYVLAEGNDGMPARLQAHQKHHQKQADNLFFCDGAIDMFNDVEMTAFRRIAGRYKPALIVVDTFAMCTGDADENSTRDMKAIIEQCRRVVDQLDCALMVVHHTNKEGRIERGNQSLRNNCETVIRVSRYDDMVQVESQKSRDQATFEPYYLKAVSVSLGYTDDRGQEVSSLVLLPAEQVKADDVLSPLQLEVLKALAVEPNASLAELAATTEQRRGVVQNVISRLTEKGYVMPWNGQSRDVTEAGLSAAGVTQVTPVTPVTQVTPIDKNGANTAGVTRVSRSQESENLPLFKGGNSKSRNHYTEGL